MSKVEKILKNDSVNLMTLLSNLGCEITGNQNIILETIKINIKKSNESYHQSRVNAISDEMIKDIIFKNQCYGNSTKMVKEIKSLLKQ